MHYTSSLTFLLFRFLLHRNASLPTYIHTYCVGKDRDQETQKRACSANTAHSILRSGRNCKCLLRSCKHSSGELCGTWKPVAEQSHTWTEWPWSATTQNGEHRRGKRVKNNAPKPSIFTQHWSKLKQKCHSKHNIPHVRTCTKRFPPLSLRASSVISFSSVSVSLSKLLVGRRSHKGFFLPPQTMRLPTKPSARHSWVYPSYRKCQEWGESRGGYNECRGR